MGDALKRRKLAASLAALALGLTLAGCGNSNDPEPGDTATSTSADGGSSPTVSETGDGSSDSPSSSPDPSASGDWWPEQPETMATGQEFPDDFEPATLEHPARNVPKPVMPEEAKQETETGAQAFLDYRTDAVWYAFQTGDTQLAREVTADGCENCMVQFNRIDTIYSDGGWIAGGYEGGSILEEGFIRGADGVYNIPVETKSSGVKVTDGDRLISQQHPFDTSEGFNVNLIFRDGKWVYITASPRNP